MMGKKNNKRKSTTMTPTTNKKKPTTNKKKKKTTATDDPDPAKKIATDILKELRVLTTSTKKRTKIPKATIPSEIKHILKVLNPLANVAKGHVVREMYIKIKQNIRNSKNNKNQKAWVFIDMLLLELHPIMEHALMSNHKEFPPITRHASGRWGLDTDQKALNFRKKDFMNCAEEYDYVVQELLYRRIYSLGGHDKYQKLLAEGWIDSTEVTKAMSVNEIKQLVAKKKNREDEIFARKKQIIQVRCGKRIRSGQKKVDGIWSYTNIHWPTEYVEAIPVTEIATMECTGGASSIVKKDHCAIIGGVSIVSVDGVFVDRSGTVYMIDGNIRKGEIERNVAHHSNICFKVAQFEKKGTIQNTLRVKNKDGTYGAKNFNVGRVVLSAFYPHTFPNQTVEHLDGNFRNSHPENLVNCLKWINLAHKHSGVNHDYCELRDRIDSSTGSSSSCQ
jgi:hypothetical protein